MPLTQIDRFKSALSPQLQEKANQELNEPYDETERVKFIDRLLEAYKEKYPGDILQPEQQADKFLIKFLRSRKYNLDDAARVINRYIHRSKAFPEVFEYYQHQETLQHIFDAGCITLLNGFAKNESTVVVVRPTGGIKNPSAVSLLAAYSLMLDHLLSIEAVQVNGFSVVMDAKYSHYKLVKQLSPSVIKKSFMILDAAVPMRLKNIFVVNGSWLFKIAFSLVKPFIKERILKRIIVVDDKLKRLHELIEPECLPIDYGGKKEMDDACRNFVIAQSKDSPGPSYIG